MGDTPYQISGSFSGADQIINKFKEIDQAVQAITKSLKEQSSASGQSTRQSGQESGQRKRRLQEEESQLKKVSNGYHRYTMAMREARQVWREQMESIRTLAEEGANLSKAEMRFRALNLSAEDNARGFKAVRDVVKEIGGVRLDEMTQQLTDLHSIFGDLTEAIEYLPMAAKTQYVFGALFGESPRQTERDIYSMMKALELMGALRAHGPALTPGGPATFTTDDKKRFEEYYDTVVKMKALTGGRISGDQLQQFAKTGSTAAKTLSPEGLRNMTYLIQEMGGSAAGSALMSMVQSWVFMRQGAGGSRAAEAMAQLGLLRAKDDNGKPLIEWTKRGTPHISKLRPGAMPLADELLTDPLKFAEDMKEVITKYGKNVLGKDVDWNQPKDVARVVGEMTGNRRASAGMVSMLTQIAQFKKDAANVQKAMSLDEMKAMVDDSAVGKMMKFEAALKNFEMTAGQPLLELLGSLSSVAGPAFAWAAEHPTVMSFALALFGLYKAASLTFGVLAAFRSFQASNAIITTAEAAAGATTQVTRYGRALSMLPSAITTTIGVAGLSLLMYYISYLKDEKDKAIGEAAASAGGSEKATRKLMALPSSGKDSFSDQDFLKYQAHAGDVSKVRDLARAESRGLWDSVVGLITHQDYASVAKLDPNELEGLMRKNAPGLKRASYYGQFMQAIDTAKMSEPEREAMRRSAQTIAGPNVTDAYDKALADSKGDQYRAILSLIEKERDQERAASQAQEQLDKLAGSAGTLSERFASFKFPGESETPAPPEHAAGGLTKRTHFAKVHRDEVIMPLSKARDTLSGIVGSGGGGNFHFSPRMPIYIQGGGDPAEIQRAVYAGIMQGKDEVQRAFNIWIKDRRPGA